MAKEVSEAYTRFKNVNDAVTALNNGTSVYGYVNGRYRPLRYSEGKWQYQQGLINIINYNTEEGLYYRLAGSRLAQEQAALGNLLTDLMSKNNGVGNSDNIEVSIISFATYAGKDQTYTYVGGTASSNWQYGWNGTEVDWTSGTDTTALMNGVNDPDMARGTNWEEALKYAKEVMDEKKELDGPDEDYYVIFLTDGGPTATSFSITTHSKSYEWGAYYGSDQHGGCEEAYKQARDDALALVDADYKLYNIFTYGNNDDYNYMIRLTNFAYSNGTDDTTTETQYVKDYFTNATTTDKLIEAFQNIFSQISVEKGHAQVKLTDGLRQDALTSSFVNGKPSGVTYTVAPKDSPNAPIYIVTATVPEGSDEPVVTFKIGNNEYSTVDNQVVKHVKEPVEGDPLASYDAGTYYSATVDGIEYKMALAALVPTADDNVSTLTWNLSPVGMLMDDCIYKADFIVWPNQDAYDYVAALNNGLTEIENPDDENADPIPVVWNQSSAMPKVDSQQRTYYEGGCAKYPSIVYYPDPGKVDDPDNHIYYGTFAVLTNTDQNLDYSIVTTENGVVTSVEPQPRIPMELPDPMPLEETGTFVLKKWNVNRDAGVFAQYLYDLEGNPKKFRIKFDIYQGTVTDSSDPYTSVNIGWDDTAGPQGTGAYVWEGPFVEADYGNNTYTIGTHWKADFDISAGLMLSDARMTELKLDKSSYPSAQYGNTVYYILESGHDYTVKEDGENIGYEFDFVSPVYHPMLVDGVMRDVDITNNGTSYVITGIAPTPLDTLGLEIENKLRAYLHLNKVILDGDGSPLPNDKTKFEYTIDIHSPIKLVGKEIPWYAINDLFYHDGDFNYYQADPIFDGEIQREGVLTLTTESGHTCEATCEGMFDPDIAGPTTVHYADEEGEEQEIALYGNMMTSTPNQQDMQAVLKINQEERLTIANIPADSSFEITESQETGYELAGVVSDEAMAVVQTGYHIQGNIVQNADNNVTYKNRLQSGSLKMTKIVQIDGEAPATSEQYSLVDGDYIFTVENTEDNTFGVKKYVLITVQNGVAVSYRIADTEAALSETESVIGSWAILTDLAEGDYVITETAERNGLLLTGIARGDASETVVDQDNGKVTVHVTANDTVAAQANAQATFTNNYYNNDGPDRIALDIKKTFNGLVSAAELPDDFRVVIGYSVPGRTDPIEIPLKKDQNETIETADEELVKIKETTDGFTLHWHITNIPASASAFTIREANYDSVTGYTFTAATLDESDITDTAGNWHEVSVEAPVAHLEDVTGARRTSDAGHNLEFFLEEGDILLSKLTANQGTMVISIRSLNTLEREAIKKGEGWPAQGGFKKDPILFFSYEEHPNGFERGGKDVSFSEENGKLIVSFAHSASAQEYVYEVTYGTENKLNNATLTNTYRQMEVTLELIKVEAKDMTTPLEKAAFTMKKLDPEGHGSYLGGSEAVEKTSGETDSEGKTAISGITDGYYEVRETTVPKGYIIIDDGKFYIRVLNGVISRIVPAEDDTTTPDVDEGQVKNWPVNEDNTGNVQFVNTRPAVADDPATTDVDESAEAVTTYKFGNTPGAALPNTGGPGTRIFTILGNVLILGAGVLLWRRRRTI